MFDSVTYYCSWWVNLADFLLLSDGAELRRNSQTVPENTDHVISFSCNDTYTTDNRMTSQASVRPLNAVHLPRADVTQTGNTWSTITSSGDEVTTSNVIESRCHGDGHAFSISQLMNKVWQWLVHTDVGLLGMYGVAIRVAESNRGVDKGGIKGFMPPKLQQRHFYNVA